MQASKRPPPRRKSCDECIKAKRRCDQQIPKCGRCTKMKLSCHYSCPLQHSAKDPNLISSNSDISSDFSSWGALYNDGLLDVMDTAFLADASFGTNTMPFELDDDLAECCNEASLIRGPLTEIPVQLGGAVDVAAVIDSRMKYSMDQLKLGPRNIVNQNETPWSHALLYDKGMPESMQNAYAACALYVAKNDVNRHFIFRHITGRLDELLAANEPATDLDRLAKTQALLLYSVILMFDGGIYENARINTMVTSLENSTGLLEPVLDREEDTNKGGTQYYPSSLSAAFWKSWIFRESARRTYLASFCLLSIFHLLKGDFGYCTDHAMVPLCYFTVSRELWGAKTVLEFSKTWNQQRHRVVRNFDMRDLVEKGRAEELDAFSKMFLVAFLGRDDAEGWFHVRGLEL